MLQLQYAEVMASYACNLSCVGCTNYADYNYTGHPEWLSVEQSLSPWLGIVEFESFGVIGGEPLLNPELPRWLRGLRALMPRTKLYLSTNGTRLKHFPGLIELLVDCAPSKMTVAAHLGYEKTHRELMECIAASQRTFQLREHTYTERDGTQAPQLNLLLEGADLTIELYQPRTFVKSFQGFGTEMRPWDHNDPLGAIAICPCRYCPILYEGRFYKCSQIALLKEHLTRLGLIEEKAWQPYLSYKGIAPTDDPRDIERFVRLLGAPESICKMCPSKPVTDAWIDHTTTVLTKREWQRRHGVHWPPRR
jgi:hypothetical protein